MPLPLLLSRPVGFPHPSQALDEPDGLLAAGGALTVEWLLEAYSRGIFPWFGEEDEYILWWSPSKRAVLKPGTMRVSRSLKKRLKHAGFTVTVDRDFEAVIAACQAPRKDAAGTWITAEMQGAYTQLHNAGFAHSFEVWHEDKLVGGLYGVSLGCFFFGESMFSTEKDASKVAFFALQRLLENWQFELIDCQLQNPHLESLGVVEIPRTEFLAQLAELQLDSTRVGNWSSEFNLASLN